MARKRALDPDEVPVVVFDLPETVVCDHCESKLHSGGRSRRSLWFLDGPKLVVAIGRRCSKRDCPGWYEYHWPRVELDRLALRTGDYGLDVLLEIGHLRVNKRLSVPEIHRQLREEYPALLVSERQVTRLLHDYEAIAQASLLPADSLRDALKGRTSVTISLDGLQPDQDKDMLWIVRDVESGLPLASLTHPSVTHVEIAALLREVLGRGLTITGVVSDGQDCILKAVREALPGVAHQICQTHFLGNLAKPLLTHDAALRKTLKRGLMASGQSSASSKRLPVTSMVGKWRKRQSIRCLRNQPPVRSATA